MKRVIINTVRRGSLAISSLFGFMLAKPMTDAQWRKAQARFAQRRRGKADA